MPQGICGWVQQVAGVPVKGGRETVLSWPVILIECAGKEGKKIGKSVRGEMVQIRILCLPPSCKWCTFTCHRFGLHLIVQVNCYTYAHTN